MPQELPEGWTHTKINASDRLVPYITIISTLDESPIGKRFFINKAGEISKKAAVNHGAMSARIVPCATPSEYLEIQKQLSTSDAIILGVPSGVDADEDFLILGQKTLLKLTGGDDPTGWFSAPDDVEHRRMVCRLKDQWLYSTIRLFDLDAPDGTPDGFLYSSFDSWLSDMGRGIPELLNVEMLVTQSNTGRVMGDVTKLHVIYAVPEDCDVARLAEDILISCWSNDLGWYSPREGTDSLIFTPIYDRTVMVGSQRIVYDGVPEVSKEIPFDPALKFIQVNIGGGPLGPVEVDTKARAAFCEGTGGTGGTGGGASYATVGVDWDESWETRDYGAMTLAEYRDSYRGEHVRCQIHQRDSRSMNGYFGCYEDGTVFVYDNGHHVMYRPDKRNLCDTIGKVSAAAMQKIQASFSKLSGRSSRAMPAAHGPSSMKPLKSFVDKYVLIGRGSIVADIDRPAGYMQTLQEFRNYHANNRVMGVPQSGSSAKPKMIPMSELWLTDVNRKTVREQDFNPNKGSMFMTQESGMVFNTWQPIPVPAGVGRAVGGLADLFLGHLEHLLPCEADRKYFLQFLAHAIQKPGERPDVALILTTFEKGTGRGYTKQVMDALLGGYSQTLSFIDLLESQFNPFMYRNLMVTCEEVHMNKSPSKRDAYSNKLRSMVTEKRMTINIKGISQFPAQCYVRHILHTNHADAISMDMNERRFYVMQCASTKMPNAAHLFSVLEHDPQFLCDMHAMLMNVSLADFNPHEAAVVTEAMKKMVETADSQQMQVIKDVISEWPKDVIQVNDILLEARKKVAESEEHTITSNLVAGALREVGADFRRANWRDEENKTHNIRVWIIRNIPKWREVTGKKVAAYLAGDNDKKAVTPKILKFPKNENEE